MGVHRHGRVRVRADGVVRVGGVARGSQTRQYNVLGTFMLKRLSDIATLTSN